MPSVDAFRYAHFTFRTGRAVAGRCHGNITGILVSNLDSLAMAVKFGWLLPSANFVVDGVLVLALIAHSNRFVHKTVLSQAGNVQPVSLIQEGGTVMWDPKTLPPTGPFMLIVTGNVPAGLISERLRPDAGALSYGPKWDRLWFALHEAIAFACWFVIGTWVERHHKQLRTILICYSAVRFLLALTGTYDIGWRIQILWWLGFTAWSVGAVSLYLIRRIVRLRTA